MKIINIIILGPQGSGKGTQAELMSERLDFYHVETGKILREMAKKDKDVYELIYVRGELYPDQDMINVAEADMKKKGVFEKSKVFDGYPRTVAQYRLLKKWLIEKEQKLDLVILIDISEEETIMRLSSRRTCEECGQVYNLITNPPKGKVCDECGGKLIQRNDDKPEVIKRRLALYNNETKLILKEAEKDEILKKFDGERPIEEIFEDIKAIVEKYK